MSSSHGDRSAWPASLALQVEEVCNRFEVAWRDGAKPRIETYLGETPEPGRSVLLHELLALELEYRRRSGDVPAPEEYHARFPEHGGLVRKAFGRARREDPQATGAEAAACPPCPTGPYGPADTGTGPSGAGTSTDAPGPSRAAAGPRRHFTPLRPHAQGGLGTVSLAFDETLRRQVALKEIRPELRDNAHLRRRFLAEAEITGQLEHPGVVPIYALEHDAEGQPYYAMRFIQGKTLAEAIQAYHAQPTPLAFHALLKRFLDVCQTMAYTHSRGVIHRDLKPTNVMLGDYGETLVVDWGLAKRLRGGAETQPRQGEEATAPAADTGAGSADLTEAGQVLGTPAYMSPEQADGRAEGIGPATDIYALGAILYELLTGQPPYRGAGLGAILSQVRQGPPPPPGQVRRGVPRALEAVCLKAMARAPAGRYASAAEVAREVERWLADEPVAAYREPLPVRLARWGRRHRTLVMAVGLVLLTVVGAAIIGGLVVGREQERAGALAQADALPGAAPAAVPALLKELAAHRNTVRPRLLARWQYPALTDGQRLRVGLTLADDVDVRARLIGLARKADDPQEVLLVRDALVAYPAEVRPLLWEVVGEPATPPQQRFRLLAILAKLDPNSENWQAVRSDVVNVLVQEDVLLVGGWAEALRPVRGQLIRPLADVFRDTRRPELERSLATGLLADYAADQVQVLADLLMDADEKQFAVLYPKFTDQAESALPFLNREVGRELPPHAVESEKERQAKRQANAAVILLLMDHTENVWRLLKHSPDPRVRSYLIHRFGPLGANGRAIVKQLQEEQDVGIRRALILCLGEFGEQAWGQEEKTRLVRRLQDMYRTDPDPGVHAAAEWLLRQWKEEAWLKETDEELAGNKEQREERLQGIRQELARARKKAEPRWWVNQHGQTMVLLPGPVEFVMGSPPTEADREPDENQNRRRISRTFAIAAKPVTVAEYQEFDPNHRFTKRYAPLPNCPVAGTNWYQAAAYCNWLSDKEKIPPDQWCYETDAQRRVTKARANCLSLTGYRFPTEAEWEYACRAEALTSRYYGESEELLGKYAWFLWNASGHGWPVGMKKPNDLGLFDMHGNVWNWCLDRYKQYPEPKNEDSVEDGDDVASGGSTTERVSRGVSFMHQGTFVRSATRNMDVPTNQYSSVGFRLARTFR
jgi:formylglycine-generating enzyme required for sulfatase activity/tRNA A-37 threonylcarbamoyl transferase component Bud32